MFYFLFLRVLRCFSSPGSPPTKVGCRSRLRRVAPFGNPRLNGYLPLSTAYRSLSRPSSPPRAKASFMRPSLLSFFLTPRNPFFQDRPVSDASSAFIHLLAASLWLHLFLFTVLRLHSYGARLLLFASNMSMCSFSLVVPGRVELPTSTLSV